MNNNVHLKTNQPFEDTMNQIQKCYHMRNDCRVKQYFEKCYEDLKLRNMKKEKHVLVSKISFVNFLNLPILVGDKIFKHFVKEEKSGVLTKEKFVDGMYNLYFGGLTYLLQFTFEILDFTQEKKIRSDNVLLFYSYSNTKEIKFENLERMITKFFNGTKELNFIDYTNKIKNESSDLFFIFLFQIYNEQPFTEEVLKFSSTNFINYRECFQSSNKNFKEQSLKSENENKILQYSKPILNLEIINEIENSNLNLTDNEDIPDERENYYPLKIKKEQYKFHIELPKINFTLYYLMNKKNKNNKNNENFKLKKDISISEENILFSSESTKISSSLSYLENDLKSSKNYEIKMYRLNHENKLIKFKLILLDKNIFSFRYSNSQKNYQLNNIYPLNGYLISTLEEIKLADKIFYPLALLDRFGDTMVNLSNMFFIKDKKELNQFYDKLKVLMNLREIKEYYEMLGEIGKGQFGSVNLGIDKSTGDKVAIKRINKKKLDQVDLNMIRSEIDVMRFLIQNPHDNIVQVFDILEDRNFIYIVLEYVPCNNLNSYLEMMGDCLEEDDVKFLALQLAKGLKFLSKCGILHRDLKPENILVCMKTNKPILKISDFGLSKVMGFNEKTNEGYGTLVYTAPEILTNKTYDNKVDVWSYGIVLHYMLTGLLPFDGKDYSMKDIAILICHSPLNLNRFDYLDDKIKDLLMFCISKNVNQRFTIDQVLDCTWFA